MIGCWGDIDEKRFFKGITMSSAKRIAVFGAVALSVAIGGCDSNKVDAKVGAEELAYEKKKLERVERFRAGPYVESDKEIAPGERIRVVVIPSKHGRFNDANCVLYTNLTTGSSSITCPNLPDVKE